MIFILFFSHINGLSAAPIQIVAAENVYGNVAKQIGGPYVNVINILNNPNQDPHLFSVNPSTGRAVTEADIIIYNNADYDPWMKSLLAIKSPKKRDIIVVAQLMDVPKGSNPHIWYIPATMPRFAQNLAMILEQHDPQHKNYYQQQLKHFKNEYQIIFDT